LRIHLIDGTYELFRHYHAVPKASDSAGQEVGAVRGVIASILSLINRGATHVGVATDHVIESFRNRLWRGYKTSAGVPQDLLSQFTLLEDAISALGVRVWPMIEVEADDALAAAAERAASDARVEKVFICTPDKDLGQSVRGNRVVQLIRRTNVELDEDAIVKKFGVRPTSIPDYLALVGDSSDGYPGLPGWGAKSTAAVLARFGKLEEIPADWREWRVNAANAASLAATLQRDRELVFLFRDLATLRTDVPVFESVDELEWKGPTERFAQLAARFDAAKTGDRGRGSGGRGQSNGADGPLSEPPE
jgi:5'-3' exonuclease